MNILIKKIHQSESIRSLLFISFFLSLILLLYWKAIFYGLSYIDDHILLSPIESMTNFFREYQFFSIKNMDIQPTRDISFYLDHSLFRLIQFKTYHLTNILIFSFLISIFSEIVYDISEDLIFSFLIGIFFITNPLFVNSVVWISARKHLLACLYFLAFLKVLFKHFDCLNSFSVLFKLYFFYCLSFLSQPITLLLPFALINKESLKKNKITIFLLLSIFTSIFFTFLSIRHYQNYAVTYSLINVGGVYDYEHFGKATLALGRYFFNMVYPFHLFFHYSPSSYFNLLGLIILISYLIMGYRYKTHEKFLVLQKIIFLFLSTVTIYRIGNFVSDTYILGPYFSFILSLVLILYHFKNKYFMRYKNIFLIFFTFFFSIKSYQSILRWENFEKMIQYNYENEFNDFIATVYISILFSNKKITTGIILLNEFYDLNRKMLISPRYMWSTVGISIYLSENFYPEAKEKIFKRYAYFEEPNLQYFRALVKIDLLKIHEAYRILNSNLKLIHQFIPGKEVYLGRWMALCQEVQEANCQHQLMERVKNLPSFNFKHYTEQIQEGEKHIRESKEKAKARKQEKEKRKTNILSNHL